MAEGFPVYILCWNSSSETCRGLISGTYLSSVASAPGDWLLNHRHYLSNTELKLFWGNYFSLPPGSPLFKPSERSNCSLNASLACAKIQHWVSRNKHLLGSVKTPGDSCLVQLRIQPMSPNKLSTTNPDMYIAPARPWLQQSRHPVDHLIWLMMNFINPYGGSVVHLRQWLDPEWSLVFLMPEALLSMKCCWLGQKMWQEDRNQQSSASV